MLENSIDIAVDIACESGQWSEESRYPIFIILVSSENIISKGIRAATKSDWSHVMVAFDTSLARIYQFGNKDEATEKDGKGGMGFAVTNPHSKMYIDSPHKYVVYTLFVNKEEYRIIREMVSNYLSMRSKLKYHFKGCLNVLLKLNGQPKNKMLCSRFVAELLSHTDKLEKGAGLYKPHEFSNLSDITELQTGSDFSKYDKAAADRKLESIIKARGGKKKNATAFT